MGGGAHPKRRRAVCKSESCSETLKVQCGEDGAERRKRGSIAYKVTSGVRHSGGLESDGVETRGWVETVTEGVWRFIAKWRKEEEDATRHHQEKEESSETKKVVIARGRKRKTSKATPVGFVNKPKESCTGTR